MFYLINADGELASEGNVTYEAAQSDLASLADRIVANAGIRIHYRPEVGDHATYGIGSDAYAVEVIAVSASGHKVTVRDMTAKLVYGSGFSEQQVYEHTSNPQGTVREFTRRKGGDVGSEIYLLKGSNYGYLSFRRVRSYRDPSF